MLPKVEVPTYELTLPSTDKKIKYRPFLVKEEKILFMALESKDNNEMITAIKEIIKTCTFNDINTDTTPLFDIEYIFLNIRAKSVGEVAKFKVICPDDGVTYTEVEVDMAKVEVHVDDDHTNKIIIDENKNLGLVLTYPTLNVYKLGENMENATIETMFNVLINCIDHVFQGDKIYSSKDFTKEEIKEFLENLPQDSFSKIKKFFDTMPRLKSVVEVINPKTNVKSNVTFTGLADFFG